MTDREALRMALELLEDYIDDPLNEERITKTVAAIKDTLTWKERDPQAYCYSTAYGNHLLTFKKIPKDDRRDYINEYPLYTRIE